MDLFYKGHKFEIEATDIVGGILITHNKEKRIVARRATWEGSPHSDVHAIADELVSLIDANVFKTIKQIPEHKF